MAAEKLINNVSYSLIRTNVKLSANVKLVTNGNDLYLDSFNSNTQLSSSKFKAFKISGNSTYDQDVYRFFQNGAFPKDLAYQTYQQFDDTSVLSSYKDQYEMQYSAGTESVASEAYSEDLSILAPLWLGDTLPKYFVVFRLDGPVAINNVNADDQDQNENLAQTSIQFSKNVLENCTAIKTFDLTENSKLGSYLRNYKNQKDFPVAPVTVSWKKDESISWNGISYSKGGFSSGGSYSYQDLIVNDTTIINTEYFFTQGFQKNGIICANLINLQFLFNDEYADEYSINRYFGLYVNDVDEGIFDISGKGFYEGIERGQLPKITSINEVSERLNKSFIIENENGVLIYLDENTISTSTGIPTPARVNEVESIFYVKDKNNQFHTIKKGSKWETNQLRLSDKKIDVSVLAGFKQPDTFANAIQINRQGSAMFSIKVLDEMPVGSKFDFYDGTNFISQIAADDTLPSLPGQSKFTFFNPKGTPQEIAKAIASAINNGIPIGKRFFNATYNNDTVYIISRYEGTRFNRLNVYVSWDEYQVMNISTYPETNQVNTRVNFIGGGDIKGALLKVTKGDELRFKIGNYAKTKGDFASILDHVPYTIEPITDKYGQIIGYNNIDEYVLIRIDASDPYISSTGQLALYSDYKPSFGRFSFFPLKDFDFDFYSNLYSQDGELSYESAYYNQRNSNGQLIGVGTDPDTKSFYTSGGFANLIGLLKNSEPDTSFDSLIESEYQRLEENYLTSQAIASRVIPYINKWGYYKSGKDVRNKPYRLNLSEAFTLNNFAPSQYDYNQYPLGFSHEWYYLCEVPHYFSDEAIKESWSYFNTAPVDSVEPNPITGTPYTPGTFQDVTNNNFDDFFIVDKLYNSIGLPVILDRQIRYSSFAGGNNDNFAQTFLRGVKIIAKPKAFKEQKINFNARGASYVRDGSLNDYKFSAILVPNAPNKPNVQVKFVKNDKWKTITMMIFINISYQCFNNGTQYVDRTMLYSAVNSIVPTPNCEFIDNSDGSYEYTDGIMQGAIRFDISGIYPQDTSQYLIRGTVDLGGVPTRFLRDVTLGLNGQFNDIEFSIGSDVYKLSGISRILTDDQLLCTTVTKNGNPFSLPSPSPSTISMRQATYKTLNGGYDAFRNRLNAISFASIAYAVNQGDPSIVYETIDINGNPVRNDNGSLSQTFVMELQAQDDILKSIYVGILPDNAKPTVFNLVDIIGYSLSLQNKPRVTPIARHYGNYEPIANDLLFFKDPYIEYDFNSPTGSNVIPDEDYKKRVFNFTRYGNTQFNSSKIEFGQIRNLFYHKVNTEDASSVLELSSNNAFLSLYPLINEVGIDYRDFYTFSSNWDPGYFRKSEDKFVIIPIIGTRSMTEKKSYMGSKYLKVPQEITLETFIPSMFSEDAIKQPSLVDGTFVYSEDKTKIDVYLFIEKRLIEYLFQPVKDTFLKYVNPLYGYGNEQTLDDDVIQYIKQNVLSLYKIGKIELFTRSSREIRPTNYQAAELTNSNKYADGLSITDNFSSKILNTNQFDTRLIYNKKSGYSEDIGFSVTIIKK